MITVKSESYYCKKSESDYCEKWKWWHNWQTCAQKMEQQLILEKPDSWHWQEKMIALKSESKNNLCEKWKWLLWERKGESDGMNGTAIFDSWHSNERGSRFCQLWVTKVLSYWFTDSYDQIIAKIQHLSTFNQKYVSYQEWRKGHIFMPPMFEFL